MCSARELWAGNSDSLLREWFGNTSASWAHAGFKGRIETRRGEKGVGLYLEDTGHDA